MAAAFGLLKETSSPFGRQETFLPGAGPLTRGLRFMGVRLAKGFDAVTGSVYGLPSNLAELGDFGTYLLALGTVAFADAYSIVDNVYCGWSYAPLVDLSSVHAPDLPPARFRVGTRKVWGMVGLLEGAVPEFETLGDSIPEMPKLTRWYGYKASDLSHFAAPVAVIHSVESGGSLSLSCRTISGVQASVPVQLYGAAAHRNSGGWTSFTVPLYLWSFMEGELTGGVDVPASWRPQTPFWVSGDAIARPPPRSFGFEDFC
jgi:hypothetical protein